MMMMMMMMIIHYDYNTHPFWAKNNSSNMGFQHKVCKVLPHEYK